VPYQTASQSCLRRALWGLEAGGEGEEVRESVEGTDVKEPDQKVGVGEVAEPYTNLTRASHGRSLMDAPCYQVTLCT